MNNYISSQSLWIYNINTCTWYAMVMLLGSS
jgi:hypothetical protein